MMCNESYVKDPEVYAVKHNDFHIRMDSRSGGAFTALSDVVLEEKGIVYGCVLTADFRVCHTRAEKAEDRNQMRGSKYVQSTLGDTYKHVKDDLDAGLKVMFSGTSCQVAGLRAFLVKEYDGLLCVDIVCHGVPSQKVFDEYIRWQEKKGNGKCMDFDFRNKRDHGWASHVETLEIESNGRKKKVHSQVFKTIFYGHAALRPSCYWCPYKSINHPGDITLADYWGINRVLPEFNDNNGVSLVLINNVIGERIFKKTLKTIDYRKCKIENSLQQPLINPFPQPQFRNQFWEDFKSKKFIKVAKKYGGYGIKNYIKNHVIKIIKKVKKCLTS